MRSKTLCLAAALVLAPAALTAQDSTATPGASGASARVETALETAAEAGIPASLLERKLAEGKAKGVPMERIAGAIEQRLEALMTARDALTQAGLESTTEGELSVAADAVQAGVSQRALATISRRASEETRPVAIAVLTDLVALGQASEQAVTRVESALARGPEALANLSAESAGQVRAEGGIGGVQVGAGAGARVELGGAAGR